MHKTMEAILDDLAYKYGQLTTVNGPLEFQPAHYPVPALVTCFEYWPECASMSGVAFVIGMDHHKPGRWREFLHHSDNTVPLPPSRYDYF